MAGYDDMNPPAIVREAPAYSLKDLARKIRPLLRRQADNAIDIGEQMELLFARVTGHARTDFLRKHFGIGDRQARKYVRAYRSRDTIREKQPELSAQGEVLTDSLAAAMRILEEDAPDERVASNGEVPFPQPESAALTPETGPDEPLREPGGDESYQEDLAGKIRAVLCLRCTNIGVPTCELCKGKAARIRAGEQVKPGVRTKPNDQRDKPDLKNGQVIAPWNEFHSHISGLLTFIHRVFVSKQLEFTPAKAGYDRTLEELMSNFKKDYERITGQKAPRS